MTDLDKMAREQFEAWAAARGWSISPARTNCDVEATGMYGHPSVQRCWEAWEAAALTTPPPGYVLVPAELPVEMEVAFCEQWFSKRRAIDDPRMQDCWAAMIAAAPEPEA